MTRRAVLAAALLGVAAAASAQTRVTLTDVGPGQGGRLLRDALRRPHHLVPPDTSWFVVNRGELEPMTVIVLDRSAAIAGRVEGDVIVVGGDLFLRPGADVSGSAIAIGGAVYPSAIAHVGRGVRSYRDVTYEITRDASGYGLAYRSIREHATPPLFLPGVYGLRSPTYDRVNGLAVPFGPDLTFAGDRGELNALATYRSDLGAIDPSVHAHFQMTRRLRLQASAERATFSNDAWIWWDFVNSLSVLSLGTDTRNYFRADRGQLTVHRLWETASARIEPMVGIRSERAWSVGPAPGEQRKPWSLLRRNDSLGVLRPNPPVDAGALTSVLAGAQLDWESGGVTLRAGTEVETSLDAARLVGATRTPVDFSQVTSNLGVGFLTFGEQEYGLDVHWVTTLGDTPPRQRFVYMGGAGTLPFLELLEQGGDELLLVDQRYAIPLPSVRVGIMGMPTLLLRHRFGSAGPGKLPAFEQVLGLGVLLTIVRAEAQLDPRTGKVLLSTGFTFSR